jgi:alanyl-tRNA synthetase
MQADILREKFLNFFSSKGHKVVESDSLVPKDDPTVLFTPAGMNQFKKEFLGFDSGFKRAATSQRCLRTDDLDKVGKTSSHHTFFEMLGNFSFGDYFKKEAIAWAWQFLTEELKMEARKLWVSVYHDDDEAYGIWKDTIKVPAEKIVRLGDKDNFWPAEAKAKGPNGPCGPCSEIFYDFGKDAGCGKDDCSPACNCGRFVEIWNLVFTQFNRMDNATLEPLPNKNIDTGMGLERLTAVMEGKENNFQTELFEPLIKEIQRCLTKDPLNCTGLLHALADHSRAVTFSIYDGILPSNEGRGYVVRKIIRKSVLHLRSLGIGTPYLNRLVPVVAQIMHKPYPDLKDRQEDISRVVLMEESNFINSLDSSEGLFKDRFASFVKAPDEAKAGKVVFELYDTYGIPPELTKEWLSSQKISFSQQAFEAELNLQKERSRQKSAMKGDVFDSKGLGLKIKDTVFCGYHEHSLKTKILAILKDGRQAQEAGFADKVQIVLEKTPFYPESGGQTGDTGRIISAGNIFEVQDTRKADNIILHTGKVSAGSFKEGDMVSASIEASRRLDISRNHTATHILQAALRKVLGSHVQQQGSLVAQERFRFDFTHFKGLTEEEIKRVEEAANEYINAGYPVKAEEMSLKQAREAKALAFFAEKYGEKVRVVSIGSVSRELCAGAHVDSSADIGLIKIVQEGSVASGIRRIEGVTAGYAQHYAEEERKAELLAAQKRGSLEKARELRKEESLKKAASFKELVPKIIADAQAIGALNLIFYSADDLGMEHLRTLADMIKGNAKASVIVLGGNDTHSGRASLVIALTADLANSSFDAAVMVRQVADLIGGSGGGRKDFAQAGGKQLNSFELAFAKLRDIISSKAKELKE